MIRSLLRLMILFSPMFIVAAAWMVWWLSPERPLREWRQTGSFGFSHIKVVFSDDHAEFYTVTKTQHPSVQKRQALSQFREQATGHMMIAVEKYKPDEIAEWRLDLRTGVFTRLPDALEERERWYRNAHFGHFDEASKIMRDVGNKARDRPWRAVGEERSEAQVDIHRFLKQWIGWDGKKTLDLHLCIFDTTTDRMINDVPAWEVARWTDDDQFWTVDTIYTFKGVPAGVSVRLWSVHAAPPPWWMWSLTIAGVGWYAHRIWRWRRGAGLEPSLIT